MKIHVLKLKLRKLHKYLGFAFSLFILHLTVTGILLTYPKIFNIEETYMSNFFILKKYNIPILTNLINKILYRAQYRGTKEMDIFVSKFVNSIIDNLDHKKLVSLGL